MGVRARHRRKYHKTIASRTHKRKSAKTVDAPQRIVAGHRRAARALRAAQKRIRRLPVGRRISVASMFGIRTRRLEISKRAHDAALDYLARAREYRLSDEQRSQLVQVVVGHIGRCDPALARAGLQWMRDQARRKGERVSFY